MKTDFYLGWFIEYMVLNAVFNIISFTMLLSQRPLHLSMIYRSRALPIHTVFFSIHWLLSHITSLKQWSAMVRKFFDSSKRGINLVAMTVIIAQKEMAEPGSNQWSPVIKSWPLPTELNGLSIHAEEQRNIRNPVSAIHFSTYEELEK